jgi:hypothetical protein
MLLAMILSFFLALPALSEKVRNVNSSTRAFAINGKRYLVEKSAGNDASLIHRELLRQGLDVPLAILGQPTNPHFSDALREDALTNSIPDIPLPPGLRAEHSMIMESETGPVALALGVMDSSGPQARDRLAASGWECIEAVNGHENVAVATLKKGRETFIVFLEEKKGKFLFARKME